MIPNSSNNGNNLSWNQYLQGPVTNNDSGLEVEGDEICLYSDDWNLGDYEVALCQADVSIGEPVVLENRVSLLNDQIIASTTLESRVASLPDEATARPAALESGICGLLGEELSQRPLEENMPPAKRSRDEFVFSLEDSETTTTTTTRTTTTRTTTTTTTTTLCNTSIESPVLFSANHERKVDSSFSSEVAKFVDYFIQVREIISIRKNGEVYLRTKKTNNKPITALDLLKIIYVIFDRYKNNKESQDQCLMYLFSKNFPCYLNENIFPEFFKFFYSSKAFRKCEVYPIIDEICYLFVKYKDNPIHKNDQVKTVEKIICFGLVKSLNAYVVRLDFDENTIIQLLNQNIRDNKNNLFYLLCCRPFFNYLLGKLSESKKMEWLISRILFNGILNFESLYYLADFLKDNFELLLKEIQDSDNEIYKVFKENILFSNDSSMGKNMVDIFREGESLKEYKIIKLSSFAQSKALLIAVYCAIMAKNTWFESLFKDQKNSIRKNTELSLIRTYNDWISCSFSSLRRSLMNIEAVSGDYGYEAIQKRNEIIEIVNILRILGR